MMIQQTNLPDPRTLIDYAINDALVTFKLFEILPFLEDEDDEDDEQPEDEPDYAALFDECESEDFLTPDEDLECEDHDHVKIFAPLMGQILTVPDFMEGIWVYTIDGKVQEMAVRIDQVPVYGLFKPYNIDYIVQKLPKEG